jgi:hypothetical protein
MYKMDDEKKEPMWDDFKKKYTNEGTMTVRELYENYDKYEMIKSCRVVYRTDTFMGLTGIKKIEENGNEKYRLYFAYPNDRLDKCDEYDTEKNCLFLNPDEMIELECRPLYNHGGRKRRRTRKRQSNKRRTHKTRIQKRRSHRRRRSHRK